MLTSILKSSRALLLFVLVCSSHLFADHPNNDTCDNAETVTLNYFTSSGSIGKDDDEDYYSFTVPSAGTLTITSANATRDIDGYLLENCTTELAKDEANSNNITLTFDYTGNTPKIFQLRLYDYPDSNGSTNYDLNITFTSDNIPPLFAPDALSVNLPVDISNGATVADINATDANNDPLTYSIIAGNDGAFDINSSTGILTVIDTTKFTTTTGYELTLQADDGNGGTDTALVTVTIGLSIGWDKTAYEISENTSATYGTSSILPMTITLNRVSTADVNVTYTTYNGTAIGDSDYRIAGGTVIIPAGSLSTTVNMDIYHDEAIELAETFTVTLSSPSTGSGSVILQPNFTTATVTINEQLTAPLCYEDSFNAESLDTTWRTLYSSGDFIPEIVDNRLRLTPNSGTKATAVTKDYEFPSLENIIIVEFIHYAYSGTGADGMSLVLYNSSAGDSPTPGAFGGSLGYAQKCEDNKKYAPYNNNKCNSDCSTEGGCPGFEGGWLGLGIDEYGNYQNPNEGRIGGTKFKKNAVSIRGDGNGIEGYEFLAGTNSLDPTLWNSGGTPSPGDKFKMTVDARDPDHLYISLERDVTGNGDTYVYVIDKFDAKSAQYNQSTTPVLVRLALTASTGASSAIHEIDDLKVWGRCTPYTPAPTEPPPNIGAVDVIDNYTANGYSLRTGLRTKIAGQSGLTLDAVWLGTNGGTTPIPYYESSNKDVVDMPVMFYMAKNPTSTDDNGTCVEMYQIKNSSNQPLVAIFQAGNSIATTSSTYSIETNATLWTKIIPKYINFYGMNLLDPSITCLINSSNSGNIEGMPQCVNSAHQYELAFGTAALLRCRTTGTNGAPCEPQNHGIGTGDYNHIYGCYQCTLDALSGTSSCSSDAFAIRPNTFDSSLTANQTFTAESNASMTFYANRIGGVGTTDYNETMGTSFVVDVNISDTNKTCVQPAISLTPSIVFADGNVTGNYAFSNVGDFNLTIHEVNGSEYALIDSDDTPDATRLITPYMQSIRVIPASFDLNATFLNESSSGFTYLANFETDTANRAMAAHLDLNISALGVNGGIMTNYSSLCYAKDSNATFEANSTISTHLTKLLWYDQTHDLNGSVPSAFSNAFTLPISKTQFDGNGTTQIDYLINFDRMPHLTVDPFDFTMRTIDYEDEDNVSGTLPDINSTVTFYYGRVHAPDYRFNGSSGVATIYYETYCKDANRSAFDINGSESPDSIYWYHNTLHVNSDGNVTSFARLGNTTLSKTATDLITQGAETMTLTHTPPYVDKIRMTPSPWLLFNAANPTPVTNDFNVEFVGGGAWAGDGNLGKTVDVNASIRTNRRLEW